MRGCLVTATGTGVGKTAVSAAMCAALAADGVAVGAHKPVVTGTAEAPGPWPADHELLAAVTGQRPAEVCPVCLPAPASPHLASRLAGTELDPVAMLAAARCALEHHEALVVEGVGGLLVPLAEGFSVRDFACALGLPLVVVATPGLGTLNHTLLTLEAARAAGLVVRAVVLNPWPPAPDVLEADNRATLAALGEVEVLALEPVSEPTPAALARAGASLRARRWLGEPRPSDRPSL